MDSTTIQSTLSGIKCPPKADSSKAKKKTWSFPICE